MVAKRPEGEGREATGPSATPQGAPKSHRTPVPLQTAAILLTMNHGSTNRYERRRETGLVPLRVSKTDVRMRGKGASVRTAASDSRDHVSWFDESSAPQRVRAPVLPAPRSRVPRYSERMARARITSRGRVTVPKVIRDALGLRSGDVVEFLIREGGAVEMTRSLLSLRGTLKSRMRPMSVADMDAGIAHAVAREHKRTPR